MKRASSLALLAVLVLGVSAAIARAPALKSGSYSGKTSQKLGITVRVRTHGKCGPFKAPCIISGAYRANYNCYDLNNTRTRSLRNVRTKFGAGPIRHSKYHFESSPMAAGLRFFDVKFSGSNASGRFREEPPVSLNTADVCYTGTSSNRYVTFTIRH